MADWFDPTDYEPHGIVCAGCKTPLTADNVIRVDVTDPPNTPAWDRTPADAPRVHLLQCVTCTITNKG